MMQTTYIYVHLERHVVVFLVTIASGYMVCRAARNRPHRLADWTPPKLVH
jgi:hypothetical protein